MGASLLVVMFLIFGAVICESNAIDCPPKVPRVICLKDPCVGATCSAHPFAKCRKNDCGSCKAEFVNRRGKPVDCGKNEVCTTNAKKVECEDPCRTAYCSANLFAKCKSTRCGECKSEFYFKGKKVDCGDYTSGSSSKEPTCPPEQPIVQCLKNICDYAKCPEDPEATCKMSYCGVCHAIFYDKDGKKLNCSGAQGLLDCPAKTISRKCKKNLCAKAKCPSHPDASCRVNNCGKCKAEFVDKNGKVVECTMPESKDCPPNAPAVKCLIDPCSLAKCPAYPKARCVANNCGSCNAAFYDKKGYALNCEKAVTSNKPRILKHSKPRYKVKVNKRARLFCKVAGVPKPKVTWYRGDVEIKGCKTRRCLSGYRTSETKDVSKLVITRVSRDRLGKFTCKAVNANGEARASITVFTK